MWRDLPGARDDALDVGFRIKERHAIEKLNLFVPARITFNDIEDLSGHLKNDRTLSAVFNETLEVDDFDDNVFAAVNTYNKKVAFHVISIVKTTDICFKYLDDGEGTIIQFRKSLFEKMKHVGDYYIRFRIVLAGPLKDLFVTSFSQEDKFFVSAFYTTDIIEFRLNERRSFPTSLLKSAGQMKWLDLSSVYFILIRDFKAELIRAHTDFHKMRRLENNLWSDYVSSLSKDPPAQMMLYHWRVKKTSERIDDFIALASFRTIKHSLLDYVLGIFLLGMAGNAAEAFLASLITMIADPQATDLKNVGPDWSHLIALFVCIFGATVIFFRSALKKFYWGTVNRDSH
ncbi:hypothetical protein LMG27198_01760 [Methylocystis echinoides]|uniref:Uncharacterized protein n=2 Tax=Methylocystis echinoides TaxID=29468 RepID=A0A9W6GQL6_9HYPH|nr:hypothetical protein LMG27198_01760 [Methylocystis echinoides]